MCVKSIHCVCFLNYVSSRIYASSESSHSSQIMPGSENQQVVASKFETIPRTFTQDKCCCDLKQDVQPTLISVSRFNDLLHRNTLLPCVTNHSNPPRDETWSCILLKIKTELITSKRSTKFQSQRVSKRHPTNSFSAAWPLAGACLMFRSRPCLLFVSVISQPFKCAEC